jgi:multiple sugar transport system permease protein
MSARRPNLIERHPWVILTPFLLHFAIFVGFPLVRALELVFQRWDLVGPKTFVGTGNLSYLLGDPQVLEAFRNTFVFLAVHIPTQIGLALGLALILNQEIRGRDWFRTAFFLPYVVSGAVITILWAKLYATDGGLLNSILGSVGLPGVPWLTHPWLAMPAIALMATWKNVGFYVILFLTGLQAIPKSHYEVLAMEGASRLQALRYLILPAIRPSMILVVTLSTINGFQLFIEPYVLTGGGPMGSTMSVVLLMYKHAFEYQHMGYASTLGFSLAVVIFAVTLIQKKALGEES